MSNQFGVAKLEFTQDEYRKLANLLSEELYPLSYQEEERGYSSSRQERRFRDKKTTIENLCLLAEGKAIIGPICPLEIQLSGKDGNAFSILEETREELRKARLSSLWETILREAKSGNYENLIQVCMKWFEIL